MLLLNNDSLKTIDLLQRGMGSAVYRGQVINNNLANASTPNYKRQDVTFQSELYRALESEKNYPGVPMKTTKEKHIPSFRIKDYKTVRPKKVVDFNSVVKNDGNSVDLDMEMVEASKNTMYFNALAQRAAKEFKKLRLLMK